MLLPESIEEARGSIEASPRRQGPEKRAAGPDVGPCAAAAREIPKLLRLIAYCSD